MTATVTPCRLCPEPATVTLSVRPNQRGAFTVPDPLCDVHARHVAGVMRIPVRFEPLAVPA